MVSPQPTQHEERRSSVRIGQHLPACLVCTGRGRTRVIPGERDGKRAATCFFEVDRASASVISVHAHAAGHRHADGIENRSDRPRDGADIRVPLADVVNKRCFDASRVIGKGCIHTTSNLDGVPLIRRALGPEQLGAGTVEVFVHEALIPGTRRLGTEMPEEASGEMAGLVEATGHDAALHLTQRRTAGRYWMRSSPICSPHVSQIP